MGLFGWALAWRFKWWADGWNGALRGAGVQGGRLDLLDSMACGELMEMNIDFQKCCAALKISCVFDTHRRASALQYCLVNISKSIPLQTRSSAAARVLIY